MNLDNLQQQYEELKILNTIAVQLNGAIELNSALKITLMHTIELMNMQTGWIWLLHPSSNAVYLAASHKLPPAFTQHPERLSGWCYCIDKYLANRLDSAANISDISCTRLKDLAEGTNGLQYHATVPLFDNDKKIGLLNILSEASGQLSDRHLELLETIGKLLSVAIGRARLFEKSKEVGKMEERLRLAQNVNHNLVSNIDHLLLKINRYQADESTNLSEEQLRELERITKNIRTITNETLSDLNEKTVSPYQKTPLQYPSTPLTNRELEVLHLLKQGKTNKTIATELFITERTVKFHVSTLLNKLSAGNRTEAVQIAVKRGIVKW